MKQASRANRRRALREAPPSPAPSAGVPPTSPARRGPSLLVEGLVATLLALALTLAAFLPGLHAAFVSDDVNAIVENQWVTGKVDPVGIVKNYSWWGEGRSDSPGWRPLATLSFAASHAAVGASPAGFRAVNLALHALCTGVLFVLARRLGLGREAAGAAALAFVLLPIHSEAVVWVVGRAELGAAVGFLVAWLACLRHRDDGSRAALGVAAVAVLLGMLCKENAVTALAAPAILALWANPDRDLGKWRRDAASAVAMGMGVAAWALLRAAADAPDLAGAATSRLDNPLSVLDLPTRMLGAFAVLGRYLRLSVWPSSLSVDYSWNALGIAEGFVANVDTAVAVAALGAGAWAMRRGPWPRHVVAIGLAMAAAAYSIVSNTVFVLGTILGERLFYLPSAGLCLALGAVAAPALHGTAPRRLRAAALALLAAWSVAALVVDRSRAAEWSTPVSLFEAAVRSVPNSARAHMELASALSQEGRVDEALGHFARAREILPGYATASYNEGNALARAGRYDDAAAAYRRTVADNPAFARAWHNLAATERLRGNADGLVEALQGFVRAAPGATAARQELGEALLAARRPAEALAVYDEVLAGGGGDAVAHFNRGVAHHHLGGCAAAVDDYLDAAAFPGPPGPAVAAAVACLRELGRADEAAALEKTGKVANRGTRR